MHVEKKRSKHVSEKGCGEHESKQRKRKWLVKSSEIPITYAHDCGRGKKVSTNPVLRYNISISN